MTESEISFIVTNLRSKGAEITDGEKDKVLWICKRKMELAGIEDRENYLPLLFEDELNHMVFRKTCNSITRELESHRKGEKWRIMNQLPKE